MENTVMITINPDFLLRVKVQKVSEDTRQSMDFCVSKAIDSFLSGMGYNNLNDINPVKVAA